MLKNSKKMLINHNRTLGEDINTDCQKEKTKTELDFGAAKDPQTLTKPPKVKST